MEKSWKRKKEKEEYEEGENERGKKRKRKRGREGERSSMSNSALDRTAHHPFPSSSIEDTLRLSVPLYVLALAHRSSLYSRTYTYPHIQAHTESRSHPPAARSPARPTPSRQPSLGRRVPALSVFPRPVPTTPFHAVSRRACPYTPPACNCPLYRL